MIQEEFISKKSHTKSISQQAQDAADGKKQTHKKENEPQGFIRKGVDLIDHQKK